MRGTINKFNPNGHGRDKCSFCGNEYDAKNMGEWIGAEIVICCHHCAVSILPKLLADSVMQSHGKKIYATGCEVLEKIKGPFWKALAHRIERGEP